MLEGFLTYTHIHDGQYSFLSSKIIEQNYVQMKNNSSSH